MESDVVAGMAVRADGLNILVPISWYLYSYVGGHKSSITINTPLYPLSCSCQNS